MECGAVVACVAFQWYLMVAVVRLVYQWHFTVVVAYLTYQWSAPLVRHGGVSRRVGTLAYQWDAGVQPRVHDGPSRGVTRFVA